MLLFYCIFFKFAEDLVLLLSIFFNCIFWHVRFYCCASWFAVAFLLQFLALLLWLWFSCCVCRFVNVLVALPWVSSWLQMAAPCDCGLPGCDYGCGSGSSFYDWVENWPASEPYWKALPHSPATQPATNTNTHCLHQSDNTTFHHVVLCTEHYRALIFISPSWIDFQLEIKADFSKCLQRSQD